MSRYGWSGPCGQVLWPTDGWFRESFGGSIASDGEWLLIGSWSDDTACPFDSLCSSGSAYFYRLQRDGRYMLRQKAVPDDIARRDHMGLHVEIQGDQALIYRRGENLGGGFGGGEVLVYELIDDEWALTGTILSGGTLQSYGFGAGFRLSGDFLAVATSYIDAGGRPTDGVIEIFRNIDGVWSYQDSVRDPLGRPRFEWVRDFALLPDGTLAVSEYFDDTLYRDAGIVWIFEPVDGQWQLTQELFPPDGQRFYGRTLDADDGRIAVGHAAGLVPGPVGEVAGGRVDIYERGPGEWERTHAIGLANPFQGDGLGSEGIALDGERLLALAPFRPGPYPLYPGAWAVFDFDGDAWRQTVLRPGPPWGLHSSSIHIEVNGTTAFIGHEQWTPTPDLERVGSVFAYDIACPSCTPDLDADGALTIFDFLIFFNAFDAGDLSTADFDGDGTLTIFDFLAFQTAFDAGCE